MELRHFRCFMEVASQLHFTRAAEQLGISTPAISKQIKELETSLGVRLFNRTKRAVSLTSAGQLFSAEVQAALRQFERAEETARRAGRGEVGRIELGYVASAAFSGVLQQQLTRYRASYPGVQINPHEISMRRLPEMLEEGALDLAFVRPPMIYPPGVEAIAIFRENYVVAVPSASHFAAQNSIRPADLAQSNFVVPEQIAGTIEVARRGRFTPRISATPGGLVAVIAAVSVGQGVAVVPHATVDHIRIPGITYCAIAGKRIESQIALAFRRHDRAAAVRAFVNQVRPLATMLATRASR
jgi:DNA-binding transcriptional LysR family regulator